MAGIRWDSLYRVRHLVRWKRDQVSGAIIFLVRPCPLVLLDHIAVVLVDRKARCHTGLRDITHAQPIHVQGRRVFHNERCVCLQPFEIGDGFGIHGVAVRTRIDRAIDLCS